MSVNKVILIGTCGTDPILRFTSQETPVLNIRLATQEPKEKEAQWHNITFFGGKAELMARFGTKGKLLYIEGKLQNLRHVKDGREVSTTEVIVEDFRFLDH